MDETKTGTVEPLGSILESVRANLNLSRGGDQSAAEPLAEPPPVDPDPAQHVMDYDRVRRTAGDEIEPERFACSTCRDARYIVTGSRKEPHQGQSRELRPCPDCGSNARIEPERYRSMGADPAKTWAAWDPRTGGTFNKAIELVNDVVAGRRWIAFLQGEPGIGKSHIANAALIAWCEQWKRADGAYMNVPDLLDQLRATHAGNAQISLDDLMRFYKTRGFLVLDDIGTNRPTDFADEKLYQIIDERMRRKRATIVTSNVEPGSLDEAERIEERTLSRIKPGRVELRGAEDQRPLFDR